MPVHTFVKVVALATLAASPGFGNAQDIAGFRTPARLPEAILVPIQHQAGWMLTYRNGLSHSKAPTQAIQSRRVKIGVAEGVIAWDIIRTRNDACQPNPCPDRIRILTVPEGFMAVPERAWVKEGAGVQIFIVPAAIG